MLALVIAGAVASSRLALAAFPGTNGKIAFVHRDSSLNDRIAVINADGTGETRLTTGFGTDPSFSPDGTKIVFRPAGAITVMNADGSGMTSTGVTGLDPSFSPDGAKIVYWTGSQIAVMNANGSSPTNLTTSGYGGDPVFSPDGTKIAYADFTGIWRIDADGTGKVSLFTPAGRTAVAPNWSPDGSKIVFSSDRDSAFAEISEIFVMNANGTDVARLTTQNPAGYLSHTSPAFSPDGTKIVFSRGAGGLVVMNADGSGQTTLSTTAVHTAGTDWQPIVTVAASADLALTKTDSPDPVTAGENLTYTLAVANAGPDPAAAVNVTDTLPGGVSFVSASTSQGSCSGTSTVTCDLGTLASAATATVTIVVRPSVAGTLANTASVSSSTADPNAGNNSASSTSTVVSPPSPPPPPPETGTTEAPSPSGVDIATSMKATPDPAALHGHVTFETVVLNQGQAPATGVAFVNPVPPNVDFVGAFIARPTGGGTCGATGGEVRCPAGTLAAGSSATARVTFRPRQVGTVVNSASATATEPDAVPSNNAATIAVAVRRFSIVERVSGPSGYSGQSVIRYVPIDGERNDVSIEIADDYVVITDNGAELRPPPSVQSIPECVSLSPHQARCRSTGKPTIVVDTGDEDDRINVTRWNGWSGGPIVLDGGDGDDLVGGGPGAELLRGGRGADVLDGRGGNDSVSGGPGNDILLGGAGADTLNPGFGSDLVIGGAGNDVANYSGRTKRVVVDLDGVANDGEAQEKDNVRKDVEKVIGGSGDDILTANAAGSTLDGGAGNDRLAGGGRADTLLGGPGVDRLQGGGGADWLEGGAGDDLLEGGPGSDRIEGTSGSDRLYGGGGADHLFGDDEHAPRDDRGEIDRLYGEDGNDKLLGGGTFLSTSSVQHRNILRGGGGNDELIGSVPPRHLSYNELDGGPGNDILNALGDPSPKLNGGSGNDQLSAFDGTIDGNDGNDWLLLTGACGEWNGNTTIPVPVEVDLGAGHSGSGYRRCTNSSGVRFAEATLKNIENIRGSADADILRGGIGVNIIEGNGGDDVIDGRQSDDRLLGGAGADTINGGQGDDEIVGGPGADRIFGDGDADLIEARDGTADTVDCGSGRDRVFDDKIDSLSGCEVTTATSLLLRGRR